jgi:flagellin
MSLVINTNVASLNAQRSLATSGSELKTAMERLSSGKKINSAADDAAGFAIAERMTAQIRGLNMATKNANDGLSMIATVENATNDITDMLQRVRELAVQAANDTNSATDRGYLQKEVDSLLNEINRVASQTVYNGSTVLDGTRTSQQIQVGTDSGQSISFGIAAVDTDTLGLTGSSAVAAVSTFSAANAATNSKVTVLTMGGAEMSVTNDADVTIDELVTALKAHANFDATKHQIEKDGSGNLKATMLVAGANTITLTNDGNAKTAETGAVAGADAGATSGAFTAGSLPAVIATTSSDNSVSSSGSAQTPAAGTDSVLGLSVLTAEDAEAALTRITAAIEQVAGNRAEYGSMANRLEYTVSNLMNVAEFTTAARSRIEDADFAAESARLAKAQVLQQTGTAMLAQANAASQLAIQLIR